MRRGSVAPCEPPPLQPTGIARLDALLGGGFPKGRLCEISGRASSGRTSLAVALLAEATHTRGELAAFVDLADAFDPASARAAGVELDCVLWVRAGALQPALRSTEQLMQTGGLPLVLLDLGDASSTASAAAPAHSPGTRRPTRHRRAASRPQPGCAMARPALHHWIRLARLAERTQTSLIVLSEQRTTGSQAVLALEARSLHAGFGASPHLLAGIETELTLVRTRGAPTDRAVILRLETDGADPSLFP